MDEPRCNDCGAKCGGWGNYTIYDPQSGRAFKDYCRRCYRKTKFGLIER